MSALSERKEQELRETLAEDYEAMDEITLRIMLDYNKELIRLYATSARSSTCKFWELKVELLTDELMRRGILR